MTYTPIPENASAGMSSMSSVASAPSGGRLGFLRRVGRKQMMKGVLGSLAAVLLATAAFVTLRAGTSAHYRRALGAAYDASSVAGVPMYAAPMRMPAFMPVRPSVATLAAGGMAPQVPQPHMDTEFDGPASRMPMRPRMFAAAPPLAKHPAANPYSSIPSPVRMHGFGALPPRPAGPDMSPRRFAPFPAPAAPAHMQALPRHPMFAHPRVPDQRFRNPMPANWAPSHALRRRASGPAVPEPVEDDFAEPRTPVGAPHFYPRL